MNVMRNFTLRSLALNKKRTVVTIIGVILSAAMITAVAAFITSFLSMLQQEAIATSGNWHGRINDVAAQNLGMIRENEEIQHAYILRELGYAPLEGSVNKEKPYLHVQEYSSDAFTHMSVRVLSGRLPEKSGEVIISESIQKACGVNMQIGDTLQAELGRRVNAEGYVFDTNTSLYYDYVDGELALLESLEPLNMAVNFTVVGIMKRPASEYSWSAGCAVLGFLDESALAGTDAVDVLLTFEKPHRGIFKTVPGLAERAGKTADDTEMNTGLLRYYMVEQSDNLYSFFISFAAVIITIIIVASITLIYNAFAISVSERSRQLGLLASIGATKKQKRASVLFEGLVIGVIGIPLGILSGIGGMAVTLRAISPLLTYLSELPGVELKLVLSPAAVLLSVLLSALTIFISAYIPSVRASRIAPIDAIRQTKDVKLTKRAVKTPRLVRMLFGFEAEIAMKNLKRSRRKYRATILSLILSIVLFLTASTYGEMTHLLSGASYDGYNYDIGIRFSSTVQSGQLQSVQSAIEGLELVDSYVAVQGLDGAAKLSPGQLSELTREIMGSPEEPVDYALSIIALDEDDFAEYAASAGADPADFGQAAPSAILINYAQGYSVSPQGDVVKTSGDKLSITPGDRLEFGIYVFTGEPEAEAEYVPAASIRIAAVTDKRPIGTAIQDFSMAELVVDRESFKRITENIRDFDRTMIRNTAYITTGNDQELEKQISEITGQLPSTYIHNIQSASRNERNNQMFFKVFIYGFLTLISLICIANIFNTVTTNIALRRKEFAMLRSVGMMPGGFQKMVRFESIFYGLKGLFYGLPISFVIGMMLHGMQQSVLVSALELPWGSYLTAVIMILVIVSATMLYSTSKIKRENIIDALKEENM